MRRTVKVIALAVVLFTARVYGAGEFIALAYHDVQDNPATERIADAETVSTADLVAQFAWMREHGYHPIGIDDVF
jgi:biofilm PGA synthesis lipoprotein PgaB